MIFSVIGAFYYLRVVKLMYFDEPVGRAARGCRRIGTLRSVALGVNALALLVLGIFWGPAAWSGAARLQLSAGPNRAS